MKPVMTTSVAHAPETLASRRARAEMIEVKDIIGPAYFEEREREARRKARSRARQTIVAAAAAAAMAAAVSGCSEINQTEKTQKVYAGKKDERPYDGKEFSADKARWEATLKERNKGQNEYLRTDVKADTK